MALKELWIKLLDHAYFVQFLFFGTTMFVYLGSSRYIVLYKYAVFLVFNMWCHILLLKLNILDVFQGCKLE